MRLTRAVTPVRLDPCGSDCIPVRQKKTPTFLPGLLVYVGGLVELVVFVSGDLLRYPLNNFLLVAFEIFGGINMRWVVN